MNIRYVLTIAAPLVAMAFLLTKTRRFGALDLVDPLSELATGDAILFRYRKTSALMRLVTEMSHVGLVVEARDGTKCICEAHAAGDASYLGNDRGGVFTYSLRERLDGYPGEVYVARLKTPLDSRQKQDLMRSLDSFSKAAYDTNHRWHYVTHCLLGTKKARGRLDIFCSELVARALRDAGILDDAGLSPSCCIPDDIAFNTGAYRDLQKYR